jgi:glycosyltransferase involved in cell wall biosynthesis
VAGRKDSIVDTGRVSAPSFSVVIAAHNASATIAEQLDSLVEQTFDGGFEVIVVDNGSTDETVAIASTYRQKLDLQLLSAPDRPSAPYARNVGARAARGEIVVFVDADDVTDPELLAVYAGQDVGLEIMGGKYEESRLNDAEVASWRYELTRDALPVAFGAFAFFLMGNCAIRRSLFESLGWFDESFVCGGEEVEYSIRAQLAGVQITWVPGAVVYYRHRTTLSGLSRQFFAYGRATTAVYDRYRSSAALPSTSLGRTARHLWSVAGHAGALARGSTARGRWLRLTSFLAGEAFESARLRVWHLG